MTVPNRLIGVVLSGPDKQGFAISRLTLRGRTFATHLREQLSELCEEVWFSGSPDHPDAPRFHRMVPDSIAGGGAMSGLQAVAQTRARATFLVAPANMPLLNLDLLRPLLEFPDGPEIVHYTSAKGNYLLPMRMQLGRTSFEVLTRQLKGEDPDLSNFIHSVYSMVQVVPKGQEFRLTRVRNREEWNQIRERYEGTKLAANQG